MDIVSWNVNSVRARENRILNWLDQERPDVLCLQELKCTEEQFPFDGFDALGYEVAVSGQKAYNGVGIASLAPIEEVETDLPWSGDAQARGIAARIGGVRVVNLYVPNGSTVGSDKWHYKLEWLDHLTRWLAAQDLSGELAPCGRCVPTRGSGPGGTSGHRCSSAARGCASTTTWSRSACSGAAPTSSSTWRSGPATSRRTTHRSPCGSASPEPRHPSPSNSRRSRAMCPFARTLA